MGDGAVMSNTRGAARATAVVTVQGLSKVVGRRQAVRATQR